MNFRLVTYNIHKGIGGVDRRYQPERIVEVLQHYKPDIALLQEVDDGVKRSSHHCQVDLFAEALEMPHRGYQRNVRVRQGHYGNATLSRFPIAETVEIDLSMRLKKKRGALLTVMRVEHEHHLRSLVIANAHLGLAGFERKWQLRQLLAHDEIAHRHAATPLVLAGDFNDIYATLGPKVLGPLGYAPAGRTVRTFPARLPLRPLDRVFYRGALASTHAFAGHFQTARDASDHLPLVVDFQFLDE